MSELREPVFLPGIRVRCRKLDSYWSRPAADVPTPLRPRRPEFLPGVKIRRRSPPPSGYQS